MNYDQQGQIPCREQKQCSFITGVEVTEARDEIRSQINAKVLSLHQELNSVVENLEGKVRDIVERQEKEFFFAYRAHMDKIQSEINDLRRMFNEEQYRQMKNDKISQLERELEWFKKESLQLNDGLKEKTRENEEIKAQLAILKDDCRFLEKKLHAQSNLMGIVMNQKSGKPKNPTAMCWDESEGAKKGKAKLLNSTTASSSNPSGSSSFMPSPMKNFEPGKDISQQVGNQQALGATATEARKDPRPVSCKSRELRPMTSDQKRPKEQFLSESEEEELCLELNNIFGRAIEAGAIRDQSCLKEVKSLLKANERKNKRLISALTKAREKAVEELKRFRADSVNNRIVRSDLERFFLDCIDTVRKEIIRRRGRHERPANDLNGKKEAADYSQFLKADKERVLELFVMDENTLAKVYALMFSSEPGNESFLSKPGRRSDAVVRNLQAGYFRRTEFGAEAKKGPANDSAGQKNRPWQPQALVKGAREQSNLLKLVVNQRKNAERTLDQERQVNYSLNESRLMEVEGDSFARKSKGVIK